MRSLRPSTTPGTPGSVAPITFRPGACEVREVPDRRRGEPEVRIVREQRLAGRAARARRPPSCSSRSATSAALATMRAAARPRSDGLRRARVERLEVRQLRRRRRRDRAGGTPGCARAAALSRGACAAARCASCRRGPRPSSWSTRPNRAAVHGSGATPVSQNSGGSTGSAAEERVHAGGVGVEQRCASRRRSCAQVRRRGTRRTPSVRRKRSVSSAGGPSTSARRPAAMRRFISICHRRSCACTKPSAKYASSMRGGEDVRNAVAVAQDLDRRAQSLQSELAFDLRQGLAQPRIGRQGGQGAQKQQNQGTAEGEADDACHGPSIPFGMRHRVCGSAAILL